MSEHHFDGGVSNGSPIAPRRRVGGRSARIRSAVLEATLAELVNGGYTKLTMDAVAVRAGVHKTTLYRRWATREALVVEALLAHSERAIQVPDTGEVHSDLRAVMHAVVGNLTSAQGAALARTLLSHDGQDAQISELARSFWEQRYAVIAEVIDRAIRRGELPFDIDRTVLIESLIGPLYLRLLVTMAPLDTDYADRLLAFSVPARVAPDTEHRVE